MEERTLSEASEPNQGRIHDLGQLRRGRPVVVLAREGPADVAHRRREVISGGTRSCVGLAIGDPARNTPVRCDGVFPRLRVGIVTPLAGSLGPSLLLALPNPLHRADQDLQGAVLAGVHQTFVKFQETRRQGGPVIHRLFTFFDQAFEVGRYLLPIRSLGRKGNAQRLKKVSRGRKVGQIDPSSLEDEAKMVGSSVHGRPADDSSPLFTAPRSHETLRLENAQRLPQGRAADRKLVK